MSGISTHVLDVSLGTPAAGVGVRLHRLNPSAPPYTEPWDCLADTHTDVDGRCRPLLRAEMVTPGLYRLTFFTGAYFQSLSRATLYPEVTVTFTVREKEPDYHIPLLLSPFGYTTYRGT